MADIGTSNKSFWTRPESIGGWLIMAAAAGSVLWFWGIIVPFLLSMMANTLYLGLLTAAVIIFALIAFSPKTWMLFRLISRGITSIFINVAPIAILKDHVDQMKKRRETFSRKLNEVSQQLRSITDVISKNKQEIDKESTAAKNAETRFASSTDPEEKLRMQMARNVRSNQVVRLTQSNVTFEQLKKTLKTVYDTLTRLTIYLDGAIADTENTAFTAEKNQKAVNSAVGAWRSAVAIIKGNAKENEIWDETLQHLADDSSLKMGEIDDYQRLVQNFMDKIDLESGVIPEKSIQALDSFTPKFLPAATMHPELPSSQNTEDASYANLFTKKEK